MVFLDFLLTDFKISACRSEEHYSRATCKGKQGYYFHRKMKCLFHAILVTIKSGFERYLNKTYRKILINNNKVSYSKSLAKRKY